MPKKRTIVIGLIVLLFLAPGIAAGESPALSEYQIKAGFLYNFIKFTDWPPQKMSERSDAFVIGVIGKENPFGSAFDAASEELIRGRKLVVLHFGPFDEIAKLKQDTSDKYNKAIGSLRSCHILFICSSEASSVPQILEAVSGASVLTASEIPQFLDAGGAVNFLLDKKKIVFEINLAMTKQANIEIRSQLLRIAKRVLGKAKEREK
jgi:hypothetical protein